MADIYNEPEHDGLPAEPTIALVPLKDYSGGAQISPWQTKFKNFDIEKQEGMLPLLERTWEQYKSNDLVLRLGTRKLHCNRTLLMSYSEWAVPELKNGSHELQLPENEVPYEGLAALCAWMDKSHTVLDCEHLMAVLAAATFLRVEALSRQLWQCLDLPQGIKEDRAFKLAMYASSSHALSCYRGLDTTILRRVQCFFLTLVASKEFLHLPPENICSLLGAEVAVNSEKEVFFAAVRWLTHDWAARSKHLEAIMESVRLAQLSTKYIRKLQKGTNEPTVDLIVGHPVFVELIRKALATHLFLYYEDGSKVCDQLYKVLHIKRASWRPFIMNPLCPYHRYYTNKSDNDFTYNDFLAYLRCLQISGVNTWKTLKVEKVQNARHFR